MQWIKTHTGALIGALLCMAVAVAPLACVPKTASTVDPTKRVDGAQLQLEQTKAVADLATQAADIRKLQAQYAADLQSRIDAYNAKSQQEQEEFTTAAADLQGQADRIASVFQTVGNLATSVIGSLASGNFSPTAIWAGVAGLLGTAGLAGGAAGAMAHASVSSFKLAQLNRPWDGSDRRGTVATATFNLASPAVAVSPMPGDGITAVASTGAPPQTKAA